MADYEKMYKALFNEVTEAIEILKDIQRKCEEFYVDTASETE